MPRTDTRPRPEGRLVLASGILLLLTLGFAAASSVQVMGGTAQFRAPSVPFDLEVAATEGDTLGRHVAWQQGNPVAATLAIASDDRTLAPGGSQTFAVGVRNASDEAAASVTMSIVDTDPSAHADLFDALEFTVSRAGTPLPVHRGTGTTVAIGDLRAGEHVELTLTVSLPAATDNTYNGAATRIGIRMDGESR